MAEVADPPLELLRCQKKKKAVKKAPHTGAYTPGSRIVPSCHPGWGAFSDLGGSFAERGFKIGHHHCGTTTRAIKGRNQHKKKRFLSGIARIT